MADGPPVVVIGSGPCGAAAARRLVARGLDVVMLDAGLRAPRGLLLRIAGKTVVRRKGWNEYSQHRHDADASGPVAWMSSLSLGGLSNYWTAAIPRYAPDDFTDGGRLDERYVWPVTYDELAPYYDELEPHMGLAAGGPILNVPHGRVRHRVDLPDDWKAVAARAEQAGVGMGATPMARGRASMLVRRGTEYGSYHCTIADLEQAPGFQLVTGAYVTKLEWEPRATRVGSVAYVDRRTGARHSLAARAVVLAAGTIDTTAIVLRSTSADFPEGVGNSAGLVGRYLHDHPREWWEVATAERLTALSHPVYIARAAHAESPPLLAASLMLGQTPRITERAKVFTGGRVDRFGVQVLGTMIPQPEVGVQLGSWEGSRPQIRLSYDAAARANMAAARARIRDVLAAAGVRAEVPGPFHDLLPGESVHYAGTVRMHADPRFGVLDRWNRMYDVGNVAVADPSCFTTGPEKNPTLTAMALATRAADRLADDADVGRV